MNPSGTIRVALAAAAGASLIAGFSGGLARLGLVPSLETAAEHHGALVLCGFLGTLISLERAAAQGGWVALAVPAAAACGAFLLLVGRPEPAAVAFLLAGLGLFLLTAAAARRMPSLFTAVMTVGAALWPLGTAWWVAGWTVPEIAYTWLGFVILTITAERIELSRLLAPGIASKSALAALVVAFVGALAMGQPWSGTWLLAASLAGLAGWLLANDVALRTIRTRGLARFSAACLLLGYGWLLFAAGALVLLPPADVAFGHDAAIHAIGLGFVLSMVFAHAPIILPAVAGARVRYVPALYVPVAVLQAAVAVRITGDLLGRHSLIVLGAWLAVASLVLYAATLASTSLRAAATR